MCLSCKETKSPTIIVGARPFPLSIIQVDEVLGELQQHYPYVRFEKLLLSTIGDRDKKTSLRALGQTDFFTKEIDQAQLAGKCRISVHSAKDLPESIPEGLVTKGLDPSDVLVLAPGMTLDTLPKGAAIGTSTERREKVLKMLRPDLTVVDLRGCYHERLRKMETALIRLGWAHLNRVKLPGSAHPFQGRLAILARSDDQLMANLFSSIDSRLGK